MVETVRKITKNDGRYLYGTQLCIDANDAYCRFRDDYHASLGKRVYRRLNMPERAERIHGFHVYFDEPVQRALDAEFGEPKGRVPYRLLGMANLSYCRGLSGADMPDYEEDRYERWFDWFLSHGQEIMRQIGLKDKAGRTSKNKRRYR